MYVGRKRTLPASASTNYFIPKEALNLGFELGMSSGLSPSLKTLPVFKGWVEDTGMITISTKTKLFIFKNIKSIVFIPRYSMHLMPLCSFKTKPQAGVFPLCLIT